MAIDARKQLATKLAIFNQKNKRIPPGLQKKALGLQSAKTLAPGRVAPSSPVPVPKQPAISNVAGVRQGVPGMSTMLKARMKAQRKKLLPGD